RALFTGRKAGVSPMLAPRQVSDLLRQTYMTVCIAAFAAKSKAIVLVSDKMLTYGDYNAIQMQSDTGVRKLLHLGDSGWEVQFAGDGAFAEKVVYQAMQEYEKK